MKPKQVRAFRDALGLTLDQMAEALQVNRQTWHRWEAGTATPPPFLWRALEHLELERKGAK